MLKQLEIEHVKWDIEDIKRTQILVLQIKIVIYGIKK